MTPRILVTGGSGMVGTELRAFLPDARYVGSQEYDLTKEEDVTRMFAETKPDIVIHLAAHVGSLHDNIRNRVAYFDDNVLINTLVTRGAYRAGVRRFIGVLSTCIYPSTVTNFPIKEEELHNGPPHEDLYSYAYAKRCLAVQLEAYAAQYGVDYTYLVPCNMYSEHCKAHEGRSHYVNALISKIIEAQRKGEKKITLFGDGTPLRQFMHARDFAHVIALWVEKGITMNCNVAPEENLSVAQIARIALDVCGASDFEIVYDPSKPNGQMRKDVSTQRFRSVVADFKFMTLQEGIRRVYEHLLEKP